jgi:hypothetical protein
MKGLEEGLKETRPTTAAVLSAAGVQTQLCEQGKLGSTCSSGSAWA